MTEVQEYLDLFAELRRRKRWQSHTVLRFAALSLAAMEDPDLDHLIESADLLRKRAGIWSSLNSPIRFVVAATILRHGLDPWQVYEAADFLRDRFRERGLRKAGTRGLIAALVMVLRHRGKQPKGATLLRMKQILDQWKADHRWITDSSDYPMAAFHACSEEAVPTLTHRMETIYQEMRHMGYRRGNALQLCSHILGMKEWTADEAAQRFAGLDSSFREHGLRPRRAMWDELAIISLLPGDVGPFVNEVLDLRARLRGARPRPTADTAFSLATGLVMQRILRDAKGKGGMEELFHLRTAQSVLEAEQAVVIASAAAASAAAAGS